MAEHVQAVEVTSFRNTLLNDQLELIAEKLQLIADTLGSLVAVIPRS